MATQVFSFDRFLRAPLLARAREVEGGLPASALRAVADGKMVTMSDLVGIVGSRRTLDRRVADNATLSTEESDRLARFADILAIATDVMGGRAEGMAWLRAPQFDFDGTPPIELMRTHSGGDLVLNLLRQIEHGMVA